MSDRELLELAAKASKFTGGEYCEPSHEPALWFRGAFFWQPLTDDGDALRLAVACGFELHLSHGAISNSDGMCIRQFTPGDLDDLRRAIVSAAADIGRAMP